MFDQAAEYYDQIYSFKNYAEEAETIAKVITSYHPHAKTILDVGCGTGEHIKYLLNQFSADGLDLDSHLIEIARRKNPSARFTVGDMRSFQIEQRYDVIQCLFSSIGYLTSPKEVSQAIKQFSDHLSPNGIVIIEPWYAPESWIPGKVFMKTYEANDLHISRMSYSEMKGTLSILHFHYLIGDASGIRYVREQHELALYTVEEMKSFFEMAGMQVDYDPVGIFDRGLYIGRKKSDRLRCGGNG